MRLKRKSGAVLVETGMFAGMVGAIATVLMMVIFDYDFIAAAFVGVFVAVIVGVAMSVMMRNTLEGPRGPGNIAPNKTAVGSASSSARATTASEKKAAPKAAAPKAEAPKRDAPKAEAAKPAPKAEAEAKEEDEVDVGTKPKGMSAAREGGPDDLKQIKGVGPKLEDLLHSKGFYHFDQIADWTDDEVAWVDENLVGFKGRVSRDDWVAQAKTLAAESA